MRQQVDETLGGAGPLVLPPCQSNLPSGTDIAHQAAVGL